MNIESFQAAKMKQLPIAVEKLLNIYHRLSDEEKQAEISKIKRSVIEVIGLARNKDDVREIAYLIGVLDQIKTLELMIKTRTESERR